MNTTKNTRNTMMEKQLKRKKTACSSVPTPPSKRRVLARVEAAARDRKAAAGSREKADQQQKVKRKARREAKEQAKREAEEQANARGVIGRALIKRKARKDAKEQARREAEEQVNAGGVIMRAIIKRKARREAEEQAIREAEEANVGGVIGRALIKRKAMREAEEKAKREAEEQANAGVALSSLSVICPSLSSLEAMEGASAVFPILAKKGKKPKRLRTTSLLRWRNPKRGLPTTSMHSLPAKGKRPRIGEVGHHRPPLFPRRGRRERSEEPTEGALAALRFRPRRFPRRERSEESTEGALASLRNLRVDRYRTAAINSLCTGSYVECQERKLRRRGVLRALGFNALCAYASR